MDRDDVIKTMFAAAKEARNSALQEAAEAAGMNLPNNEPGEYARGRLAARDAILALIET